MNAAVRDLSEARAARDAARAVFDARLDQIKQDLAAQGVGSRVAGRLSEDAMSVLGDALDVASESKGVIAGTIVLVALWFLRQPIIAWIVGLMQDAADDESEDEKTPKGKKRKNSDE